MEKWGGNLLDVVIIKISKITKFKDKTRLQALLWATFYALCVPTCRMIINFYIHYYVGRIYSF